MHISEITTKDLLMVGSKALYLSNLNKGLESYGAKIPETFVIPSKFYLSFIEGHLENVISSAMTNIEESNYDSKTLKKESNIIREEIAKSPLSTELLLYIQNIYLKLNKLNVLFAVRSSSTAEDLDNNSFAGQYDSFLNLTDNQEIITSVKLVYASLYSERAIRYRRALNIEDLTMPVIIQEMIDSDESVSGVAFSCDIIDDEPNTMFVSSTYGMCEMIVNGMVTPDEYFLDTKTLEIKEKILGFKNKTMTRKEGIKETSNSKKEVFSLSDEVLKEVSSSILKIRDYFSKEMDVEWVISNEGVIYIVQSRPITTR